MYISVTLNLIGIEVRKVRSTKLLINTKNIFMRGGDGVWQLSIEKYDVQGGGG